MIELLSERIAELEEQRLGELAADDLGWDSLSSGERFELTRTALDEHIRTARVMYLKDPMVNRAVEIQKFYVWAQGVNIRARHPLVNEVVQAFLDDVKNKAELTSPQARADKEKELQTDANLFFACFTKPSTGRVRVRSIPVEEIRDIETNPEDAKEPWYYRRERTITQYNSVTGQPETRRDITYYPDINYRPKQRPPTRRGYPVRWDAPVYHEKVGGFSYMRFGVPETLPAHDWVKAYKRMLSDDASRSSALAKFAFTLTTKGGADKVAAARQRLGREPAATGQTTPASTGAGGTFVTNGGATLDPMKLSGTTLPTDHSRPVRLMSAAGLGWPETFFGDASVGNHATAKTLDRPTELRIHDRQMLWASIIQTLTGYVIDQSVKAPTGKLKGTVTRDEDGEEIITLAIDPETREPMDRTVDVSFPDILEHDARETIGAIISAATLNGKTLAGTMPEETVWEQLMNALGLENVDELIQKLRDAAEEEEKEEQEDPPQPLILPPIVDPDEGDGG